VDFQLNLNTETVDHAYLGQPLVASPETSLREVLRKLREQHQGGILIQKEDALVGIFTERDALRLMAAAAKGGQVDYDQPIKNFMQTEVVSVADKTTVGESIRVMSEGGYRRLPVINSEKIPTGVLTVSGILHYLVDHFPQVIYTLPPKPRHAAGEREGA